MKSLRQFTPLSWQRLALFALWVVLAVALCSAIAYGALLLVQRRVQSHPVQQLRQKEEFPAIDTKKLSPVRAKIITIAHQQFDAPQPGVFYSQGERQDWCANFVSWVHQQAGAPFVNPHNGGWRIPGVRSLEAYYRATGRWHQPTAATHPSQAMPSSTTQPVDVVSTLTSFCATKMANSPPLVATKATQSTSVQSIERPLAKFVALVRRSRIRIFSALFNGW